MKDNTKEVVTRLIDSWNVGIKEGYIGGGVYDYDVVQTHMNSVGITVLFKYNWDKYSTKFVMAKMTADTIRNPFLQTESPQQSDTVDHRDRGQK